jgi:hypothetical protein
VADMGQDDDDDPCATTAASGKGRAAATRKRQHDANNNKRKVQHTHTRPLGVKGPLADPVTCLVGGRCGWRRLARRRVVRAVSGGPCLRLSSESSRHGYSHTQSNTQHRYHTHTPAHDLKKERRLISLCVCGVLSGGCCEWWCGE